MPIQEASTICTLLHPNAHAARANERVRAERMEYWTRIGYMGKGVAYSGGALFALLVIFASDSMDSWSRNARQLLEQPFKLDMIVLIGLGLVSYSCSCFMGAWYDRDHTPGAGSARHSWLRRLSEAGRGLLHLALAAYMCDLALRAALRSPPSSLGGPSTWIQGLAAQPVDASAISLAGAISLVVAGREMIRGYHAAHTTLRGVGREARDLAKRIGLLGMSARAVALAIFGLFLMVRAWKRDAGRRGGFEENLEALSQGPAGQVILLLVAAGMMAYGLHCFTRAWCGSSKPGAGRS